MFRRTAEAYLGVSMCVANHVDLSPGDHFAANKAIAFLIQRVPLPEFIDSSQDVQFFFIGQLDRTGDCHGQASFPANYRTIRRAPDWRISQNPS
jgi:hypothetical protein